jgi:DNA ligase D
MTRTAPARPSHSPSAKSTRSSPKPARATSATGNAGRAKAAKLAHPAGRDQAGDVHADGHGETKVQVGAIVVTHPDRLLYEDPPLTKLDLVRYYESVAPAIMPHLRDRRVALLRCPDGATGTCFFQKHLGEHVPRGIEVQEDMIVIRDLDGLLALVQRGVMEFHTWGAKDARADRPDRLTFDLDPDPEMSWRQVAEATARLRDTLTGIGLVPFLKTTGGKGLHVVVPLRGAAGWDDVREFCKGIAQQLEDMQPQVFVATMSKAKRRGHIFVDYLRNSDGATAVAALSTRARDGAPVSMPVAWDILDGQADPRGAAFNVCNVQEEIGKWRRPGGDPWAEYESARKPLTAALRRKVMQG